MNCNSAWMLRNFKIIYLHLLCFILTFNLLINSTQFYSCFAQLFISVNELLKVKEDLTKERDEQLSEIVKLREQLAQSASRQQDLEAGIADTTSKIQEVCHPTSSEK